MIRDTLRRLLLLCGTTSVLMLSSAASVAAVPQFAQYNNPDLNTGACKVKDPSQLSSKNCGIVKYVVIIINALSALVGVVIVVSLIIAGIQYSSAGSNPQTVAAARQRIVNAIIALLVFIFMFAFLQWIVPGGVL